METDHSLKFECSLDLETYRTDLPITGSGHLPIPKGGNRWRNLPNFSPLQMLPAFMFSTFDSKTVLFNQSHLLGCYVLNWLAIADFFKKMQVVLDL